MTIASLSAYHTALQNPRAFGRQIPVAGSSSSAGSSWLSTWAGLSNIVGSAPATPSTAVALDNTSAGAMIPDLVDANDIFLADVDASYTSGGQNAGASLMIVDRLSHQGGLVGNLSTTQTTNLPTAALTRYTNGVGVMAAFEVYTAIGGTGTTISCSYTNDQGVSGQTSDAGQAGATTTTWGVGHSLRFISLQSGDKGIRSVENVTLAATTGTAGNFGVTLFRPLMMVKFLGAQGGINSGRATWNTFYGGGAGSLPQIQSGAHLCAFWITPRGPSTGQLTVKPTVIS